MNKAESNSSTEITEYWNNRWECNETGWDIGQVSPAIAAYLDQYPNKNAAILIPGCGNAHEAEYLLENGFTNITLIDIAPKAVEKLKAKFGKNTKLQILCTDFFKHQGNYDLILEQTFFCAIPPSKRKEYIQKTVSLLNENGKLVGVLFNTAFENPGPPFGGSFDEYFPLFSELFEVTVMSPCSKSFAPRANRELFINLTKK